MTPNQIEKAAASLRQAETSGTFIPALRYVYPDMTIADAYEIQRLNTVRRLDEGRRRIGCKIGLTSAAVQKQLGVEQPDFGVLFDDMSFGDGEPIPFSGLSQPKIEAEIAFVLGRDLDMAHAGIADVIDAVAYALPALEIVGSRIQDWDIRIGDTIADNASSSAFVLGTTPRALDDFDVRLCGMVLERMGEPVSVGTGAACLGNPLNAVTWLARAMTGVGAPLQAGDVVLSGALGPMVPVQPGEVFEARINGLGSVRAIFDLE